MSNNQFNPGRRLALQVAASTVASASAVTGVMLASSTGFAGVLPSINTTEALGEIIDCQLICRDDGSQTYLLMHNKSNTDIVANKFIEQTIRFEDRTLNMAEAFTKPVTIKSQDRKLVRLKPGGNRVSKSNIIEFRTEADYPTVGTRAVEVPVRIHHGIGIITGTST